MFKTHIQTKLVDILPYHPSSLAYLHFTHNRIRWLKCLAYCQKVKNSTLSYGSSLTGETAL